MTTYFIVPVVSNFISIGVIENRELCYLDLNFIDNTHNWGFTLVDPEGQTYTELTRHDCDICKYFKFGNSNYIINITKDDTCYRIMLTSE